MLVLLFHELARALDAKCSRIDVEVAVHVERIKHGPSSSDAFLTKSITTPTSPIDISLKMSSAVN